MTKNPSPLLLLTILLLTIAINSETISCAPPPDAAVLLQSQPPQSEISLRQLSNIIDVLIGSTDFANWATIFSSIDLSIFPMTATLFVPANSALFSTPLPNIDPFLFSYHIVPQRLSFSELRLFDVKSRLPTLLPDKTILITSNSSSNFTLDDCPLTHPDLYATESVVIHGIAALLDYKLYGDISDVNSKARNPRTEATMQMTRNGTSCSAPRLPREEMIGEKQPSSAAFLCCKIKAYLVFVWLFHWGSWILDLKLASM